MLRSNAALLPSKSLSHEVEPLASAVQAFTSTADSACASSAERSSPTDRREAKRPTPPPPSAVASTTAAVRDALEKRRLREGRTEQRLINQRSCSNRAINSAARKPSRGPPVSSTSTRRSQANLGEAQKRSLITPPPPTSSVSLADTSTSTPPPEAVPDSVLGASEQSPTHLHPTPTKLRKGTSTSVTAARRKLSTAASESQRDTAPFIGDVSGRTLHRSSSHGAHSTTSGFVPLVRSNTSIASPADASLRSASASCVNFPSGSSLRHSVVTPPQLGFQRTVSARVGPAQSGSLSTSADVPLLISSPAGQVSPAVPSLFSLPYLASTSLRAPRRPLLCPVAVVSPKSKRVAAPLPPLTSYRRSQSQQVIIKESKAVTAPTRLFRTTSTMGQSSSSWQKANNADSDNSDPYVSAVTEPTARHASLKSNASPTTRNVLASVAYTPASSPAPASQPRAVSRPPASPPSAFSRTGSGLPPSVHSKWRAMTGKPGTPPSNVSQNLNPPSYRVSTATSGAAEEKAGENNEVNRQWTFQPPPNNQRSFYFPEDTIEFTSEFDSGNLIHVERVSPFRYRMYSSMDCGNSTMQTNNRQWFHFAIRGASRGVTLTFTFVGMMHSNMFTYEWTPVSALMPLRSDYVRIPGKARVDVLDTMPATPGFPMLVHRSLTKGDGDSDEEDNAEEGNGTNTTGGKPNAEAGGVAFTISPWTKPASADRKKKTKKKKKPIAMNLTFEYRVEMSTPVLGVGKKNVDAPAIYLASNHPYSYTYLQKNLVTWEETARLSTGTRSQSTPASERVLSPRGGRSHLARTPSPPLSLTPEEPTVRLSEGRRDSNRTGIYFHKEVLCKSLEENDIHLLTISDSNGMSMNRAALIPGRVTNLPYSSAMRKTQRPFTFSGKQYVVLTARVHPGECPGSHLMHGCINFLMDLTDQRSAALRSNFVFLIVPMLNPDGVIRGHSRVDANGVDLNRMYRDPCPRQHPAPFAVMALLRSLRGKVALFIDMHAHANKRGTFFYGNSVDGAQQVENLLYARLVAMNTPYMDFRSCNYSEGNMFAMNKSGKGRDTSSRVVVFMEAGIQHGYTIETSPVMADTVSQIMPLVNRNGEEIERFLPRPAPLLHSPMTFADTGRAMLIALIDLHSMNPLSRLPYTPYHSALGVSLWIERQVQLETAEMLFTHAYKLHAKEMGAATRGVGSNLLGIILNSLTDEEIPQKITLKDARLLPRITYSGVQKFIPLDLAAALLAQTAPSGPPRSLLQMDFTTASSSSPGAGISARRARTPPSPPPLASSRSLTSQRAPVVATRRRTGTASASPERAIEV